MADDNGEENGNGNGAENQEQQQQTEGGVLRKKLTDTLEENQTLKGKLLIHESGLGHLNEKQRNAVVREAQESGSDLTPELLKTAAKELGYQTEAPKQDQNKGQEQGGDDGGNNGQVEVNNNDTDQDDAINSMDAVSRAMRQAAPSTDPTSFDAKLAACKNTAEVEALIRSEGHRVGIVHALDVE